MIVDIKNTKVYLISPGTDKYNERLQTVFMRLVNDGFKCIEFVRSLPFANGTNSLTLTVMDIFKREMNGTEPFIIIEDDCAILRSYNQVEVPDNFGMLYLGVSAWTYNYVFETLKFPVRPPIELQVADRIHSYNEDIVRIEGMTSTHAIMYNNRDMMRVFLYRMEEVARHSNNMPHDLLFCVLHRSYNVFALKTPMFYQDGSLGGQESATKLIYDGQVFK